MVLNCLAVDNFDFTRKIVKKIWGEKLVKMLGFDRFLSKIKLLCVSLCVFPVSYSDKTFAITVFPLDFLVSLNSH